MAPIKTKELASLYLFFCTEVLWWRQRRDKGVEGGVILKYQKIGCYLDSDYEE